MTRYKLCYENALVRSAKSPSLRLKDLLHRSPFKAQDTSLEATATQMSLWLDSGEIVSVKAAHAFQIECAQGAAWATRNGDPQDYLLTPGANLCAAAGAHIVAQARSGGCRITIKP